MGRKSGTIRHRIAITITGAALALILMPMLAGRAGAEAPGSCNWAGWEFWKGAEPAQVAAQVDRCIADGANLAARAKVGWTPLHWAAWYGTPETVAALIDAGADLEARDENGETPLHHAAGGGTPETVAALLDAGADPKARAKDGGIPGRIPAGLAKFNSNVRDHAVFQRLNQARFD